MTSSPEDRRANLLNVAWVQLGCAGPLVAAGLGSRPVAAVIGWVALGLALVITRTRARDAVVASACLVAGTAAEWGLSATGAMHFTDAAWPPGIPPWLPPSWALVGLLWLYPLRRLRRATPAILGLGVVFGALGLWGAVAVGEIVLVSTRETIAVVATLGLVVAASARIATLADERLTPRR